MKSPWVQEAFLPERFKGLCRNIERAKADKYFIHKTWRQCTCLVCRLKSSTSTRVLICQLKSAAFTLCSSGLRCEKKKKPVTLHDSECSQIHSGLWYGFVHLLKHTQNFTFDAVILFFSGSRKKPHKATAAGFLVSFYTESVTDNNIIVLSFKSRSTQSGM